MAKECSPGWLHPDAVKPARRMLRRQTNIAASEDFDLPVLQLILNTRVFTHFPSEEHGLPFVWSARAVPQKDNRPGRWALPFLQQRSATVRSCGANHMADIDCPHCFAIASVSQRGIVSDTTTIVRHACARCGLRWRASGESQTGPADRRAGLGDRRASSPRDRRTSRSLRRTAS